MDGTIKPEETPLSFVDQVKKERELMEKAVTDNRKILDELKDLRALDLMSGKAEQTTAQPKKELTPEEYNKMLLSGKVPEA